MFHVLHHLKLPHHGGLTYFSAFFLTLLLTSLGLTPLTLLHTSLSLTPRDLLLAFQQSSLSLTPSNLLLASLPVLPLFCSSFCVDNNTQKWKSGGKWRTLGSIQPQVCQVELPTASRISTSSEVLKPCQLDNELIKDRSITYAPPPPPPPPPPPTHPTL